MDLPAEARQLASKLLICLINSCFSSVQVGVILGPFDVKETPTLVDFLVLVAFHCPLHERERDAVLRVQFKVEGDVLDNMRQFLQAVDIVRL
jgi:hypothetical protein